MNETAIKALGEHAPLLLGLGGLAWILWKVVQLVFWSEKRVERIATQVLASEAVKSSMRDVATGVFQALTERDREDRAAMGARMSALEIRDGERAAGVTRAHQRIDEVKDDIQRVFERFADEKGGG